MAPRTPISQWPSVVVPPTPPSSGRSTVSPENAKLSSRKANRWTAILTVAVVVLVGVAVAIPLAGQSKAQKPAKGTVLAGTGSAAWAAQRYPSNLGLKSGHLFSISCWGTTDCWIVGNGTSGGTPQALILATTDGGRKWSPQSLPRTSVGTSLRTNGHLFSNACPSRTDCWAVGSTDTSLAIISTTDGGAQWTVDSFPQSLASGHLFSIACGAPTTCWSTGATSSGNPIIIATKNGKSWVEQSLPSNAGISNDGLYSVSCPTRSRCWAVGGAPAGTVLLGTSDGGTTWSVETLSTSEVLYAQVVSSMDCATTSTCQIMGLSQGSSSGTASEGIGTTDGGKTWTVDSIPTGSGNLLSVSCIGAGACWAVGGSSTPVVISSTGGDRWEHQKLPRSLESSGLTLNQIACTTPSACWALGIGRQGVPVILAARSGS